MNTLKDIANIATKSEGNASQELIRSYYFFLTLNIRMTFMLLHVLQPELEDQTSGEDLPADTDVSARNPSREKVTAVARRVLPALRQYSIWLITQASVIIGSQSVGPVVIHAKEMWKMFADVLTRLASFYPVESLGPVNYLLEEDETTVGFKPLRDPSLSDHCNLYIDVNGTLKPHITDLGTKRCLPLEEMQARIRNILLCALTLHEDANCPIILDVETRVFIFVEEGLAIASASSPVQAPTPSFKSPMKTNCKSAVAETGRRNRAVVPDESVAASDSHNSIDSYFNHMVDNLVEPSGSRPMASNETSYGMHSRTANEVFVPIGSNGFQSHQVQSPPMLPSIPGSGLWNSAFTPQPNELQAVSPNRPGTGRQLSPMPLSTRQEQLEAAEHLERVTGYRRSSIDRSEKMTGWGKSPQNSWGGHRVSQRSSQEVNDILQRSLAEQFNPVPVPSSFFSDSSSLYANNTPLNRQHLNGGGMRGQIAPNENSTFYAGGSDFDRATMLQSSIWNGSQPRQGGYTQTPPGGQGG